MVGYGSSNFGTRLFGFDGTVKDAAAQVTAGASFASVAFKTAAGVSAISSTAGVTASGLKVLDGSASVAATSTGSAAADVIVDAAATISAVSSADATAEKEFRFTVLITATGTMATVGVKNASASMTISPQLTVTSDSLRVREGSADAVSSAAFSSNAVYEAVGASQCSPVVNVVTAAAATYRGHGGMTSSSQTIANGQITARGEATASGKSTTVVSARYKWNDAADPTTPWSKADYLERAA